MTLLLQRIQCKKHNINKGILHGLHKKADNKQLRHNQQDLSLLLFQLHNQASLDPLHIESGLQSLVLQQTHTYSNQESIQIDQVLK